MLRAHISKNRKCYDVKSSTYCFHVNTKILTGFQIYISVPLIEEIQNFGHEGGGGCLEEEDTGTTSTEMTAR